MPETTARETATRAAAACLLAALLGPQSASASAPGPEIAPHRALYEMRLAGVRSGGQVTGVSGRMAFEWGDACDGWVLQQRFQLSFQYADGNAVRIVTSYATWESKDGVSYRFNVRRTTNGELSEEVRGEATLEADRSGGQARYVRPEQGEEELPPGTVFPTAHTIDLIRAARAGERFHAGIVFDGSDAEGPTETTTAIATPGSPRVRLDGPGGELLRGTAWPIRMAFFKLGTGEAEPQYEMSMSLLENGVAESMLIDYGDFRVSGTLVELEPLPRPAC